MNKTNLTSILCSLILVFFLPFITKAQENVKKSTIECQVGKEYKVELPSTPSQGYKWAVGSPIDTTLIVLKNTVFVPGKDTSQAGKPGTDVFTFKTLKKGVTTVRLILRKEYARKVDRAEDYEFIINK